MFGDVFWDHCVVIFTKISMDKKQRKMRKIASEGQTDDQRAMAYMDVVKEKFPEVKNRPLNYLFLDACFDEEDPEEEAFFKEALEKLYQMLDKQKGLPTSQVNQEVCTEHKKIKKELEAIQKDRDLYIAKIQELQAKSDTLQREYQQKMDKLQDQIERDRERHQQKLESIEKDKAKSEAERKLELERMRNDFAEKQAATEREHS